ncbi:hypothetical protein GCHA_4315 [Paraglaciecola chathamensis S18K6]|nr:hypothetical protein GCHA_4315 [Paraglaciecola chathamensis S18K6]
MFDNPLNIFGFMTMINHNEPFYGIRPIDLLHAKILKD